MTYKKQYGAEHKRMRKLLIDRIVDGVTRCPRCHRPLYKRLAHLYDLGHAKSVAIHGPNSSGYRLEHRACNRSAGSKLGAQMRRMGRKRRSAETTATPRKRLPKW